MQQLARQVLGLIDLTSLNDNDHPDVIADLCNKSTTNYGSTPAICIYSQFVPFARAKLMAINPKVKIATVTNFPHGMPDLEVALFETKLAISRGADEVDIVFPYHELMRGESTIGAKMVREAKNICGDKTLKVIIESGVLKDPRLIREASEISIDSGADFIKTSTGKVNVNATLEAAEIMLNAIKLSGKKVGFKAAGGIKTVSDAAKYLDLAAKIMGGNWLNADNFRFGASSLLNDVLMVLSGKDSSTNQASGY